MHSIRVLLTGLLAATLASAAPTPNPASVRTIYQYPAGTRLENIAQMRNGSLLVSVVGSADIHMVNPYASPATSTRIAHIATANAALGITELSPNTFAIAAGTIDLPTNSPMEKTFAIWLLDLRGAAPKLTKLADTPTLTLPNGLATLNAHALLVADSWAGNVARVDVATGAVSVVLVDASLASNFSAVAPQLPLGANGLRRSGKYVYYSNTAASLVGRVEVDLRSGRNVRPFEVLAKGEELGTLDDVAVAGDGSVFVARPIEGVVQRVRKGGRVERVASVAGATAVVFGRTGRDKKVAYVSTSGGVLEDGISQVGGSVVAIDL